MNRSSRGVRATATGAFTLCLGTWGAVAMLAAAAPDLLPDPVLPGLGLRRDTLGFAAFVAAGAAYFVRQHVRSRSGRSGRTTAALLRTTRLFGAIVAGYIVLMGLSHPETLTMQLTHLLPFPTELTAGLLGVTAAVASHLALRRFRPVQRSS